MGAKTRLIYDNLWRKGTMGTPSSEDPQHPATDTQIDTKTMIWRTTSLGGPDIIPCDFGAFSSAGIGLLNFDSGSVDPQVGEWLFGAIASGKVVSITVSSDTWGAGTATGSIVLEQCEGCFNDNEDIRGSIGGTNILTVNHIASVVGVDKFVKNGAFKIDTTSWTAGNSATLSAEAEGKIQKCLLVARDGVADPYAHQQITGLTVGNIYEFHVYAKKKEEATVVFSIGSVAGDDSYFTETWEAPTDWTTLQPHIFLWVATATSCYINLKVTTNNATDGAYFDEVTAYELDEDDTGKKIDFIEILAHNFTGGATIELIGSMESDFSDTVITVVIPYNEGDIFYFFTSAITRRYWKLEITDALNSDGYIEIATILCGKYAQLNRRFAPEYEIGEEDFSEFEYSDSQVLFAQEKDTLNIRRYSYQALNTASINEIFAMFKECKKIKAFAFCHDYSDPNPNTLWVRNSELNAPVCRNGVWYWDMAITEVI